MYSVQGLWTAAQHRVPMTVIVLNNQGYGAVKALGRRIDLETVPGTDLPGIDFVAVAGGLGCPGRTVTTAAELDAAMAEGPATTGRSSSTSASLRTTPPPTSRRRTDRTDRTRGEARAVSGGESGRPRNGEEMSQFVHTSSRK